MFLYSILLFVAVVLFVVGSFFVVSVLSVFIGVPYLPVHRKQAEKMMELAELKPGMKTVDLGSGAGRLVFLAAENGAFATGYELNPFLVWWSRMMARIFKLDKLVDIKLKSIYQADLSQMDVVFAFLLPKPMEKLEKKLFTELKPGAMILSYSFSIPNRTPIKKEQGIFVYKV